jgi:hypothetical protein
MWTTIFKVLSIAATPINAIITTVSKSMEHKQKIKELEREAEVEIAKQTITAQIDSDTKRIDMIKSSKLMKFLYTYIVLGVTLPYVLPYLVMFTSYTPEQILQVQALIKEIYLMMPEWHSNLYITAVVVVLGASSFAQYFFKRK